MEIEAQGVKSWEALGPGLTSKLTMVVTDIALDFGTMLAVSDRILQSAHTGTLLRALVEVIVLICLNLSSFSVCIDTTCNEDWGDDQEDLEGHTTNEQWRVIKQIIDLIIKVVDRAINLRTLDITAKLNYSQEFLPCVIRSRHAGGSYNLTIDSNMLTG